MDMPIEVAKAWLDEIAKPAPTPFSSPGPAPLIGQVTHIAFKGRPSLSNSTTRKITPITFIRSGGTCSAISASRKKAK